MQVYLFIYLILRDLWEARLNMVCKNESGNPSARPSNFGQSLNPSGGGGPNTQCHNANPSICKEDSLSSLFNVSFTHEDWLKAIKS